MHSRITNPNWRRPSKVQEDQGQLSSNLGEVAILWAVEALLSQLQPLSTHMSIATCVRGKGRSKELEHAQRATGQKKTKVEKPKAAVVQAAAKEVVVDASKPKTKIQLVLPDGSKKAEEFNCDHNVGDLKAVCIKLLGQAVKVKGGFPPKDLEDDTQTLEAAGLKGAQVRIAYA